MIARRKVMSHACRGIGAFAHAIVLESRSVLNRTASATAAAILVGSVMSAVPGVALAQSGPTKVETPLIDTYTNACTGETVTVTGTSDLFLYTKSKNNGSVDFTLRVKHKGTGTAVAADGSIVSYNFHSEETTKFNDVPLGSFESAMLTKTMLVRQGEEFSDDDWMFKNTMRIKIDDAGNITMSREKVTDTCAGI
jgi:hypothetical protein